MHTPRGSAERSVPNDLSSGRARRGSTAESVPRALAAPLWSFSDREPRPVRVNRRICWVWAGFALSSGVANVLAADGVFGDASAIVPLLRLLGAALLCMVAAMPRRHIAWYAGRWVLPAFYIAMLPRSSWIFLLPTIILLFPYIRNMAHTGVRAWFQPKSLTEDAFSRGTP